MITAETLNELVNLCGDESEDEERTANLRKLDNILNELRDEDTSGFRQLRTRLLDDSEGNSRTLLHIAVAKGNKDAVRVLLNHGFSPKTVDDSGNTALHIACYADSEVTPEIIEMLINKVKPADKAFLLNAENQLGESALYNALYIGDDDLGTQVVKFLLEAGADPNSYSSVSNAPIIACCERVRPGDKDIENFKLLLQFGANYVVQDDSVGNTLHHLVSRGDTHLAMDEILVAKAKEDGNLHDLFVRSKGSIFKGKSVMGVAKQTVDHTEAVEKWLEEIAPSLEADIKHEMGLMGEE